MAQELNYRLALSLNTLVQLTADSAVGVDSTVNIQLPNGAYLTAQNIRTACQQLAAINARPLYPTGLMGGIIHPSVVHDVLNDSSAGGLTDILKRNESTVNKLIAPVNNDEAIEFAGVRFKQTSTAPTSTIGGNTYYNSYVFGDDAIFSVFLGTNPESGKQNYRILVQQAPEGGSVSDPARVIGGWISYNMKYTNTLRPGSTMTLRK